MARGRWTVKTLPSSTRCPELGNGAPARDVRRYAVFASKGGAPDNPDWFHNLVANPDVTIEVGTRTVPVRARVTEGGECERIWTTQKERYPGFAEYEARTSREIPVVLLEPTD